MGDRKRIPAIGWLALAAAAALAACRETGTASGFTREQYRTGATALYQQQLYQEAVALYRAYLASPVIPPADVPKVLYQIGVIDQDNLKNTEGALAEFTLVKALYPNQAFAPDLGRRMVACLEDQGRSSDASQALSSLTKLPGDSTVAAGSGAVVAEVNGRKITAGEVATALGGKLPEAPVEQAQAIRQYIGQLLLAQSARRAGLAEQSDVKQLLDLAETQILAQAAVRQDLKIPPPQPNDLRYYYEANQARYQHGADSGSTFEQLLPKVRADWAREKQADAYVALVQKLMQSAQVKFYGAGAGGGS